MKKAIIMLLVMVQFTAVIAQTKKNKSSAAPKKPAQATQKSTAAAPAAVKKPVPAQPAPVIKKQEEFDVKGASLLNAGVGLGTYYRGLPFGISYEYGFTPQISGGVFADYSSYSYGDLYGDNSKLTILYAGVRASYHLGKLFNVTTSKFDPYAGASLGYHHVKFSFDDSQGSFDSPYSNSVFFGVHLGARYMFSSHVGGFAEVGYGVAALKVGLTAKF